MFTTQQRDSVRERVLEMARSDSRVTAGALTGSMAADVEDEWSDIDITFGVEDNVSPKAVLDDWGEVLRRELGALHYWDLPSRSSIYRVFLLPSGLELDLSVTPQKDFGASGPHFLTLFGETRPPEAEAQQDVQYLIGLCWHHILHSRISIEREKPLRAEYWISALRDHTLELACLRLGEESWHARGIDRLPTTITAPIADAFVRSLDEFELRRALAVATICFINELELTDPALCERLKPVILEIGAPQRVKE